MRSLDPLGQSLDPLGQLAFLLAATQALALHSPPETSGPEI